MNLRPSVSIGAIAILFALSGACAASRPAAPPVDSAVAEAASSAHAAFESGSMEEAARLFERALREARAMDESHLIAMYSQNLAVCLMVMGKPARARPLLEEAALEYRRCNEPTLDVTLLEAKAAGLQGNAEDADRLADEVLGGAGAGQGEYRAQACIVKTHAACCRGDTEAARLWMNRFRDNLPEIRSPSILADAEGASGRTLALEKRYFEAGAAFDREAAAFRDLRRGREMTLAIANAAGSYREAGFRAEALDRYYRAARALHARGDLDGALRAIGCALELSDAAGSTDLDREVKNLFREIKERVDQQAGTPRESAGQTAGRAVGQ